MDAAAGVVVVAVPLALLLYVHALHRRIAFLEGVLEAAGLIPHGRQPMLVRVTPSTSTPRHPVSTSTSTLQPPR